MTANTTQDDGPHDSTGPDELEEQVLDFIESNGLGHVDDATVAANLDVEPREAQAALENLQHDGHLAAEPPVYKVVEAADGER